MLGSAFDCHIIKPCILYIYMFLVLYLQMSHMTSPVTLNLQDRNLLMRVQEAVQTDNYLLYHIQIALEELGGLSDMTVGSYLTIRAQRLGPLFQGLSTSAVARQELASEGLVETNQAYLFTRRFNEQLENRSLIESSGMQFAPMDLSTNNRHANRTRAPLPTHQPPVLPAAPFPPPYPQNLPYPNHI